MLNNYTYPDFSVKSMTFHEIITKNMIHIPVHIERKFERIFVQRSHTFCEKKTIITFIRIFWNLKFSFVFVYPIATDFNCWNLPEEVVEGAGEGVGEGVCDGVGDGVVEGVGDEPPQEEGSEIPVPPSTA